MNNKTLLITGGTGSFGNAVLNGLIDSNFKEIRIFSRDEKKQEDMRIKYMNSKLINILPKKEHETFKFYILNYLSAGLIGWNYTVTKEEISKKNLNG